MIEEIAQVFGREHRRCSTTEVDAGEFRLRKIGFSPSSFLSDRLDEITNRSIARGVLVKRAIRADPVTKGDVYV